MRTKVVEALTRIDGEQQRDTEKRSAILGALMVSSDQTDRGFHSPLLVDGCETTIMTLGSRLHAFMQCTYNWNRYLREILMEIERVQKLSFEEMKELPPQFVQPLNERPENTKAVEGVSVPVISLSHTTFWSSKSPKLRFNGDSSLSQIMVYPPLCSQLNY
ncbi:flavonol synthase/flavanone 3-hydroxylase-like [Senna tora]|uniref:Flavonol synthase/flavanone 3-hydroxylase-like n=1 Tax=Senna tora TaxID=362788 RepID=A0A834XG56_9FABA|nr:flavonol synthase/flavanone 3-hydroxylase-like [Senna tora]